MKTIIVYYSLSGNTDWAAKQIASRLGADLLRLEPVKAYPSKGFRKFFRGGRGAVMAETPALQPYAFDEKRYDLVVLGFPVWAGSVTPPIRSFVQAHDLSGKRLGFFVCQSGAGAEKAFSKLRACPGVGAPTATMVLIDPKDRPSQENEGRIDDFCRRLQQED